MSATVRRIALLLLGFAVAGGVPAQQPQSGAPARAERPEVRAGDLWSYRVTDRFTNFAQTVSLEVTAVSPERIHTRSSPAGIVEIWDRDWNQLAQGGTEYQPRYPSLQFPLEPGKQWGGAVQWRAISGIMSHKVTLQVAGWERVTVPAGTFDAVRITRRGSFVESQSINYYAANGHISDEIWYAPAVGQIVKKEIMHRDFSNLRFAQLSERWELLEYKRN